jgi:hypothetical protein
MLMRYFKRLGGQHTESGTWMMSYPDFSILQELQLPVRGLVIEPIHSTENRIA